MKNLYELRVSQDKETDEISVSLAIHENYEEQPRNACFFGEPFQACEFEDLGDVLSKVNVIMEDEGVQFDKLKKYEEDDWKIVYFATAIKVIKKETPQDRYHAKERRRFTLNCFKSTESDIIEKLESQPVAARYIKNLIRKDIANGLES